MGYAGAELEIDFHRHYGLDILDFFRGRYPWQKFLRLVDALPTASRFRDLVYKDEDLAKYLLAEEQKSDEYNIPGEQELDLSFEDETPIYQSVRTVIDLMRQLLYITAANSKAQPPEPLPRPETALEKLRQQETNKTLDEALLALTGETW